MTLDITSAYAWLGWLCERSIISEELRDALLPEVEARDAALLLADRRRLERLVRFMFSEGNADLKAFAATEAGHDAIREASKEPDGQYRIKLSREVFGVDAARVPRSTFIELQRIAIDAFDARMQERIANANETMPIGRGTP